MPSVFLVYEKDDGGEWVCCAMYFCLIVKKKRDRSLSGFSLYCDAKAGLACLQVTDVSSSFTLSQFLTGNGNQMIMAFKGQESNLLLLSFSTDLCMLFHMIWGRLHNSVTSHTWSSTSERKKAPVQGDDAETSYSIQRSASFLHASVCLRV